MDGVEITGGFTLLKTGACPGPVTLTTAGGTPGGIVVVAYGLAGSYTKPSGVCAGTTVAISQPTIGAVLAANGTGAASLSVTAKAAWCGLTVQAVDVATCTASNAIVL